MTSEGWRWEQRDDVTLLELLNALWGRRFLVGGVAATTMVSVLLLALFWGPAYVARVELAVSANDDGLGFEGPISGKLGPNAQANSEQRSEALIERVEEAVPPRELSQEAARRAGYAPSPEEFNERLKLEDDYQAGRILVSFSADDAEQARGMANAYAEVFAERANELDRRGLVGGTLAAEVKVAREAELRRGRTATALLYGGVAGLGGLLLGAGLAFALESRTRRWRGARDAELTLRAPVIGVIPDYAAEEKIG